MSTGTTQIGDSPTHLIDLLADPDVARNDKVLVLLRELRRPATVRDLRELAVRAGMHEIDAWNVSKILARAKGLAARTKQGWVLTSAGKVQALALVDNGKSPLASQLATTLVNHAESVGSDEIKDFIDEAVRCFDTHLYRAAVVLSWVGAVAVLQRYVVANTMQGFNEEARRRNPKWKSAKKPDDLGRLKEFEFLQILVALSIIGRDVKQQLEGCLALRNACGHPNSLRLGEAKVAAHLETLILNVFVPFANE